jgi:Mg-chelatase subunit ChlD
MSSELQSPLKSIIQKLAAKDIEGPAAKMQRRFTECSSEVVVLLDTSSSMGDLIGSQNLSKFEHLAIALDDVLQFWPKVRLVAFGNTVQVVSNPKKLPYPCGGTPLAQALVLAARWKPRKTIVISDGLPDREDLALEAAEELTGSIDTIYCGPDSHPAVEFLRSLTRQTGGVSMEWDGYKTSISSAIKGLLAAGS